MTRKFGELEDEVLSIFVQENRPYSVKEMQELLGSDNAYATIMTVLSRLCQLLPPKNGSLKKTLEFRS